jgi:hypothetical protein
MLLVVVDVSGPVDRAAEADAGKHIGVGERQFTSGLQHIRLGARNFGTCAQ